VDHEGNKEKCIYDLILLEPTKVSIWLTAQGDTHYELDDAGLVGWCSGLALEIDYGSSQKRYKANQGISSGG
jgi:hypothetical protein